MLTYTIEFNEGLKAGLYKNTATVTGQKGNPVAVYAVDMAPVSASNVVELRVGEVLGVQIEGPACAEYMTGYIRPNAQNDPVQVRRLQFFLRDFEGEKWIPTNGVYGPETVAAVDRFQAKYSDEVLAPWGMARPSGYLYYTTRKKINDIYCQGLVEFPLSENQQTEIIAFKSKFLPILVDAPKTKTTGVEKKYERPSLYETKGAESTPAAKPQAQSFFDLLLELGKSALAVPEVQAMGR